MGDLVQSGAREYVVRARRHRSIRAGGRLLLGDLCHRRRKKHDGGRTGETRGDGRHRAAAGGSAAVESYSVEQLKRYATAVAAVGAKETVIDESGAIEYLGENRRENARAGFRLRAQECA